MRKYLIGIGVLATLSVLFFVSKNSSSSIYLSNQNSTVLHSSNIDSIIHVELANSYQLGRKQWKYKDAMTLIDGLIEHPNFKFAQDTSKANTYHRKGSYEIMLANYEIATENITKAIKIRESVEGISDSILAESYYHRAKGNFDLRKPESALADIKESIRLIENEVKSELTINTYHALAAQIYLRLGDTELFNTYAEKIISKYHSNAFPIKEGYASILYNLGIFFRFQKKYPDAIKAYQQAKTIYIDANQIQQQAQMETNIGLVYHLQKKYKEAKQIYLKNLDFININFDQDVDLSNIKRITLNNLVQTSFMQKNYADCEDYITQVITIAKQKNADHGVRLARSHMTKGELYHHGMNKYPEAIEEYHQALKAVCVGFESIDLNETPSISLHQILSVKSLRKILSSKLTSLETIYKADQKIETLETIYKHQLTLDSVNYLIRQNYDTGSARFKFVAKTLKEYESGIQTMFQLAELKKDPKYLEEAYHFAAKNKAIVMLDGLQDETAKFAGLPSDLLEKEKELKQEYFKLESKLYDLAQEESVGQMQATKEKRFELMRNYQQMISELEKKHPAYYELKYAHQKQISSADLADQLPKEAAIAEFFIGKKNIYTFVISKENGLQTHVIPKPKNFNTMCVNFMKAVEQNKKNSVSEFSKKSNELYNLLLKPSLSGLEKDDISRLIIVPDGALLQLSFDVLFETEVDSTKTWLSGDLPYLLNKYAISYAYSNQLIFENKKTARIKANLQPYTGFGLAYKDSITLQGLNNLNTLKVDTIISRGMGKLRHSPKEIIEAANITGGKAFVNENALKATFLKESTHSKVIHLAMHGFVVEEQPLNSGLIFKRKNLSDNDYVLKAGDLYGHEINAELAILSACHTGAGVLKKGEGVRSLARAFHYAGCPTVVASLWAASDNSTKDIMISYFKLLKSGLPKDIALQQAKLDYFQNAPGGYVHPSNWTHLISIGDNQSISF